MAGPDADAAHARIWHTPGPRWFGPGDAIWETHGDASMFPGGIAALLLQSLHPLAMAGVAGHSGYRADPWGRLMRTLAVVMRRDRSQGFLKNSCWHGASLSPSSRSSGWVRSS